MAHSSNPASPHLGYVHTSNRVRLCVVLQTLTILRLHILRRLLASITPGSRETDYPVATGSIGAECCLNCYKVSAIATAKHPLDAPSFEATCHPETHVRLPKVQWVRMVVIRNQLSTIPLAVVQFEEGLLFQIWAALSSVHYTSRCSRRGVDQDRGARARFLG